MHLDEITGIAERVPFRPCTLRLANGAEYAVRSPFMIGGNRNTVYWFEQEEPFRVVRLDPALITEIVES